MALEHIEIDGKQYPYLLSYRALKNIAKYESLTGMSIESIEHALYWGLYSGHYKQNPGSEFTFKVEQMEGILDDHIELFAKVQNDILELTKKINPEGAKQLLPVNGA